LQSTTTASSFTFGTAMSVSPAHRLTRCWINLIRDSLRAKSAIGIEINKNNADARVQQARGESEYIKQTGTAQADVIRAQGTAQADVIRAQGLSKAEGFRAQNEAIGATGTTLVNIATELVAEPTFVLSARCSSLKQCVGSGLPKAKPWI
jgi:hypothetical protein